MGLGCDINGAAFPTVNYKTASIESIDIPKSTTALPFKLIKVEFSKRSTAFHPFKNAISKALKGKYGKKIDKFFL